MKTIQILLLTASLSAGLLAASGANATLISALGDKVVNDTDLNIAWLADANYAKTNGYDADGLMTWSQAQGWIASLNNANYLGYHDWRLPTTTDTGTPGCNYSTNGTDCGYNSTGSEMSHLFFNELGNKSYYNTSGVAQSGSGLVNNGPFTNFQSNYYWSGTAYAPGTYGVWVFNTRYGFQDVNNGADNMYALAVRPGQVAAVPVPAAAWLLGSGLLGFVGVSRRKAA